MRRRRPLQTPYFIGVFPISGRGQTCSRLGPGVVGERDGFVFFICALLRRSHPAGRSRPSLKSQKNTPNQEGGNAMRIRLVALALSFMVLPALAQPTLRGTPLDKFKFMSRQDIAKQLTKPWPG